MTLTFWLNDALDSISSVTFAKSLSHTQSVETEYWTRDGLEITPIVDDVIIDTEETDSESDLLTNQILNIFIRLNFFFFFFRNVIGEIFLGLL